MHDAYIAEAAVDRVLGHHTRVLALVEAHAAACPLTAARLAAAEQRATRLVDGIGPIPSFGHPTD